ncbi:polynucleotide kinase/phosphatase [Paraglaciecola Antarctic GD virus 1]|nr:polynucleotide kinase/phosphatase [Paraglaciecola Antarctic GD virus 1]
MQKLILTIGISNSGKTTWAEKYCKENPKTINLNRDDARAMLHTDTNRINDYKFSKQKELEVTEFIFECADNSIEFNYDIIVSDTNLNSRTRESWKIWALKNNFQYIEKLFLEKPHKCKERNLKRDHSIPPYVIDAQYRKLREYLGMMPYVADERLPYSVMFDIDGTLASMKGKRGPYDWDKVHLDRPRTDIINLLKMYEENDYKIIILSGRDGSCYDATKKWLMRMGIETGLLYMREAGDDRCDTIVKQEMFNEHVRSNYNVKLVFDDRQRVVDMWRNIGVQCCQVNEGNF